MFELNIPKPLVVLVGPTAVGKTDLSIRLAEKIGAEIISADSRLFYRGMDIGTAKPSIEERGGVIHHLIDVADPDETWNLALFQQRATEIITDIHKRGKLPMLVGGTGQYIQSVIEGWGLSENEPNIPLRIALEKWANEIGKKEMHNRLRVLDPQAAAAIDPSNLRRTIRAVEVILTSGKLFSGQRVRKAADYSLLIIGIIRSREDLYRRIDERIDFMIKSGFIDEVKDLLKKGYSPELPSLSAIGYKEIWSYLRGEVSLEEAVIRMKRLTRVYVRRQANWFRSTDPAIHWYQAESVTIEELDQLIRNPNAWIPAGMYIFRPLNSTQGLEIS
jgi:tRNA dimethylallyltransferase